MAQTLPQYDVMRKRAQQQEQANLQGQKDAIARRAAQLGGGVSGALIKQEQVVSDDSAKRLQDANEGINAQEAAELQRRREIEEGRQFARSEREAGQTFTSGESQKGRDFTSGESALQRRFLTGEREAGQTFARGEREAGQSFASGEADKQRGFLTGEREATQAFQTGEREAGQDFAASESKLGRDLQASQFAEQMQRDWERFLHEKDVDAFNMDMATKMFNKKDMLETFFGNFGMGNVKGAFGKAGGGISDWWKKSTSSNGAGSINLGGLF